MKKKIFSNLRFTMKKGYFFHLFILFSLNVNSQSNETFTDIDGNVYTTIKVGNQVWALENLRVTKFRNGDPIKTVAPSQWIKANNSLYYNSIPGNLYNWYAICDPRNIAPVGWHVPTLKEWEELLNTISNGNYITSRENYKKSEKISYELAKKYKMIYYQTTKEYSPIKLPKLGIGIKNTTPFNLFFAGKITEDGIYQTDSRYDVDYWTSTDLTYMSFNQQANYQWEYISASSRIPYEGNGLSIRLIKGESTPPLFQGLGKAAKPSWLEENNNKSSIFCFGNIKVSIIDGGSATQTLYSQNGSKIKEIQGTFDLYGKGDPTEVLKINFQGIEYRYDLIRDGYGSPSVIIDNQGRRYTKCN